MAEHEPFQSGLERLGGDYFATAWIDINASASQPENEPDDFSVASLAYGTDGTGVIRLLTAETPTTKPTPP